MKTRSATVAARLALFVLAFAFAGVAAELVARGLAPEQSRFAGLIFDPDSEFGWAESDPVLGWRNKPGVHRSFERGKVLMTFWDHGRRASRATEAIDASHIALLIGGSWMQGYGIRDEETLAYRLGRQFPQVAFENFGTGGYGTIQAMLSLNEAARAGPPRFTAPDLVIYDLISLHLARNVATYSWIRGQSTSRGENVIPPHGRVVDGSLVLEEFEIVRLWPAERRLVLVEGLHQLWLRLVTRGRSARTEEVTRTALSELATRAARLGARLLVVILDAPRGTKPAPPHPEIDALARHLAAEGIEHVDCRIRKPEPTIWYTTGRRSGHPSGATNRLWSECLAVWLRAHGGPSFQASPIETRKVPLGLTWPDLDLTEPEVPRSQSVTRTARRPLCSASVTTPQSAAWLARSRLLGPSASYLARRLDTPPPATLGTRARRFG